MGLFDALTTAVAGLQSQSFALQNISGNIANSQTVGYKETDTSFQDLVSQAAIGQQTAGGVVASSTATNTVGGTLQSSSVSTNMAISGDGWFVVSQPSGTSGSQTEFSGVQDYTRRGDFQLNDEGYLVNGAGYYLMGEPVNASTGAAESTSPEVLQFNDNFIPAQQTTSITYSANLPATPSVGVLNPSYFESNPINGAATPAAIIGTGAALDPDAAATGTGTVSSLTTGTTLSSLGITAGQTITVNDGTNSTTYTSTGSDTVGNLITAINGGSAAVTASLNASGNLVLTGNNDSASITITGTGSAASVLGFATGSNTFSPTNLLTQDAVSQGQTLTVQVSGGGTQTITFGTGSGQVATLSELQTQIQALTGVTGTVNTTNGAISLTANNPTDDITLGGTATLSKFGLQVANAYPANGTVIGADSSAFTSESVDGGSITAYDSQGNPVDVDFRWAKVSSAASGGTDSWQLFYQTNSSATGTEAAWQSVGNTFTFNSAGQLTPSLSTLTIPNLTVNGDNLGNVAMNLGSNALTQYASSSGTSQVGSLQQNGFAAGTLDSLSVNTKGQVVGSFSNGQTIALADITLATFSGENNLQALNGEAYASTPESGNPIYGATGTITGSSLESSNVDIATQFSSLIVAQQAYGANAKVMSTADQMIQSLLQVIQ